MCKYLIKLATHLECELLVHALVVISESVGWLAVRDLVVPEPLEDLLELARELPAYVIHQQIGMLGHCLCHRLRNIVSRRDLNYCRTSLL